METLLINCKKYMLNWVPILLTGQDTQIFHNYVPIIIPYAFVILGTLCFFPKKPAFWSMKLKEAHFMHNRELLWSKVTGRGSIAFLHPPSVVRNFSTENLMAFFSWKGGKWSSWILFWPIFMKYYKKKSNNINPKKSKEF